MYHSGFFMLFVSYSKYRLRCVMVYILYKHIGSEMSYIDNTNQVRNFISNLRAIAALRACALCVSLTPSRKTRHCETPRPFISVWALIWSDKAPFLRFLDNEYHVCPVPAHYYTVYRLFQKFILYIIMLTHPSYCCSTVLIEKGKKLHNHGTYFGMLTTQKGLKMLLI